MGFSHISHKSFLLINSVIFKQVYVQHHFFFICLNNYRIYISNNCSLQIRQMGNTHPHTVQCELNANVIIERIMVCLWLWLWFTLLLLGVATIIWIIRFVALALVPLNHKRERIQTLLGNFNNLETASRNERLGRLTIENLDRLLSSNSMISDKQFNNSY